MWISCASADVDQRAAVDPVIAFAVYSLLQVPNFEKFADDDQQNSLEMQSK